MAQALTIQMSRSSNQQPWGFRLQGGLDFATPLTVLRVNFPIFIKRTKNQIFFYSFLIMSTGEYGKFVGKRWIESWWCHFEGQRDWCDAFTSSRSARRYFSSRESIPIEYRKVYNQNVFLKTNKSWGFWSGNSWNIFSLKESDGFRCYFSISCFLPPRRPFKIMRHLREKNWRAIWKHGEESGADWREAQLSLGTEGV